MRLLGACCCRSIATTHIARIRAKNALRNSGARRIASTTESKADFGRSEKPIPRAQVNGLLKRRTFLTTESSISPSEEPRSPEPHW